MGKWSEVELFVHAVDQSSLSKAADTLDISIATASRKLTALERRLNARLVDRHSRRFVPTDIGEDFYQRCKTLLSDMAEAEDVVQAVTSQPSGTLHITSSVSFCVTQLVPLLDAFNRLYPKIDVQIVTANRYLDIIEAGIDVAIRTREYEADSGMTVRRLARTRRLLAASPDYLAKQGVPDTPEALADHAFLAYSYSPTPDELHLTQGQTVKRIRLKPKLEANDALLLRAAALRGQGILVQSAYSIHEDILAGRLVPLLEDWDLPRLTINLAYQSRKHLPAKTRLFIDFLLRHFDEHRYEALWTADRIGPHPQPPAS